MPRQKNTKPTTIYWLWDIRPDIIVHWPNGKPFYCGKTVMIPERRLQCHRTGAIRKPHGEVSPRILECGEFIRLQIIEVVPAEEDWRPRERFGISSMRLLWPGCCLNVSDGGEGPAGWVPSADWCARMSAAKKGIKKSPEHRAKIGDIHRGKSVSLETRAKLSALMRGRKLSPEHRAKIGAGGKGRKFSPEHRAKISAALRGIKRTPGCPTQ